MFDFYYTDAINTPYVGRVFYQYLAQLNVAGDGYGSKLKSGISKQQWIQNNVSETEQKRRKFKSKLIWIRSVCCPEER